MHVVCVRVTRSFDKRVEWLMDDLGTDDGEFAGSGGPPQRPGARASRMNAQFGVTWGDPLLYDLVLNTDRLRRQLRGADPRAGAPPEFQETAESRAILDGLALEARVRAALKADRVHQQRRRADRSRDGPWCAATASW